MKTNTLTKLSAATFALFVCLSVIMSGTHARDIVRVAVSDSLYKSAKLSDHSTKTTEAQHHSDLHNHTDKQTLKPIALDNPVTAREREAKAMTRTLESRSVMEVVERLALFYRLAFGLRFPALAF